MEWNETAVQKEMAKKVILQEDIEGIYFIALVNFLGFFITL